MLIKVKHWLHKSVLMVMLAAAIASFGTVESMALEKEDSNKISENTEVIIEDFKEALPYGYEEYSDIKKASESVGVKHLLQNVAKAIKGGRGEYIVLLLTMVGIALFSSIASLHESDVGAVSSQAVGIICSALLFDRLLFLIKGSVAALDELSSFFSSVIPVCLAVNTLGASPSTAAAQATGMGITLSIYSYLAENLLLPLVSATFVTSALSSVDGAFSRISKGIKGAFLWIIGIFSTLVGAAFSLQSVIASGADNVVIRSAKYAISSTIPIVGGTVSGALGLLVGGTSYARSIVGGGAVAVVISLVISPLVTILMYRLCLKLGIVFSSFISNAGCSDVISSLLGAIDMLMAAYAFTAIVYIVELVAFLKGGVGYA